MKAKSYGLILAALVVVVVLALLLYPRISSHNALTPPMSQQMADAELQTPPLPDIALEIATEQALTTYQGVPLIITARLANQRAANAEAENLTRQEAVALIQRKRAEGKISEEKAMSMVESAGRVRQSQPVRLGNVAKGWEQYIHFEYRNDAGSFKPVDWPLQAIAAPKDKTIVLDAQSQAEIKFKLQPEAANRLAAGNYEVIAILDVAEDSSLPKENWRGRATSDPVLLRILPKPANPTAAEKGTLNLQTAEFYAEIQDWPKALEAAEKAIAANPQLINAHMYAGEAREARGDLAGALQAYLIAKRLFDEQHPNSYERPERLIQKIGDLARRLR